MSSLANNIGLSIFTFLSRVLSGSIVYIVLARLMSLNDFGVLSFGTTLAGLLIVVAEFGFSLMAQRDIPQNRFDFKDYIFNTFIQKIGFSTVSLLGGLLYLYLYFEGLNYTIGVVFVVNAIVTANNMYLFAIFRAKNMFKIETWLSAIYTLVILVIIALYYVLELDVTFIAYGLLVARVVQFIILAFVYAFRFTLRANYSKEIQKYLFKNSFSFGAHYIIGIFYFSIDNQLIAYYCGNESLAIYQAIFKVVLILLSVSALLESVFLPFLSAKYSSSDIGFRSITTLINKVIITLGLCLFVGFNLFANEIITMLYSERYIAGLTIVLPLGFVLLFRMLSMVYSILLTISDHQNIRVLIVSISLILNVCLNFVFIPKYGYVGAAYVSLVTHFVLALSYILFSYKYLQSFLLNLKMLFFGLFTVGLVLTKNYFNLQIDFINSVIIMIVWMLLLFFVYDRKQLREVVEMVKGGY